LIKCYTFPTFSNRYDDIIITSSSTYPVGYIGKSADCVSCASVKESMRIADRFPMLPCFRDVNIGLARSLQGDLEWCGVHSEKRAVVKDFTRTGSMPKRLLSQYLYLYALKLRCIGRILRVPYFILRFSAFCQVCNSNVTIHFIGQSSLVTAF